MKSVSGCQTNIHFILQILPFTHRTHGKMWPIIDKLLCRSTSAFARQWKDNRFVKRFCRFTARLHASLFPQNVSCFMPIDLVNKSCFMTIPLKENKKW